MHALLALEDGTVYPGITFGSPRAGGGEVVFNTSMCGYQEILSDPSYHGQIVVFTAPHLGNYGIHQDQNESASIRVAGVVAREASAFPSHPGSEKSLSEFLQDQDIFGLTEVDTRALTLRLRSRGTLRGWLSTDVDRPELAIESARGVPPMDQIDAVGEVMTENTYPWSDPGRSAVLGIGSSSLPSSSFPGAGPRLSGKGPRVVVLDCGVKFNILRHLARRGCIVTVVPGDAPARVIEKLAPDGLVLSNGPGDPAALKSWLPRLDRLLSRYPTLAICLGHQLASTALGCRTVKLPFGHHGGNHPVMDLARRTVAITAQNHNYAIDPSSVPKDLTVSHVNLNDGTVEGLRHRSLPLWSLQYHPEASPGPREGGATFDEFVAALARGKS